MTSYWAGTTNLKVFAFLVLFQTFQHLAFSQKGSADMEEFMFNSSKDFIEFEDYESAYDLLVTLDSIRPNNADYVFNIGLCMYATIDKVKSLLYFLKAKQLGYKDNILNYYLGLSYRFNYDLDNASYYLQYYLDHPDADDSKFENNKDKVASLLTQIESSRKVLDQRLSVDVQNMGPKINSEYADYVPILLSKDSVLIFTSRRKGSTGGKLTDHGTHFEDIYIAQKNKMGDWDDPKQFPGFNGKYHDANVAINKNETELYLFKAKHKGSIYVSKKGAKGNWLKPKSIKGINSKYWEGSIGLSPTEDTIYFSSDRPGGFGESDLYYAIRDTKGNWTNSKNMGEVINTRFDEDSPYMYKDGKTFFFSSRGHNSIGGYDVFSTKLIDGKWTEVKNIGFPINTIDDDIYFQLNSSGSFGYFTSFRHSNFKERSIGEKDLFEIVRPNSSPVYFVFKGRVYDEESKEALPAIVSLKDKEDTTLAKQILVVDINSGKFRYDLKFNNRYELSIEVGDKVYFSKELFFPYQPDLFESFLDIPLKDVPSFKVRLQDLLGEDNTIKEKVILDAALNPTVVLVRNVPHNDKGLKDLLLSKRIPVSFRKRIMDQLRDTKYIDEPNEGELLREAFAEIDSINNIYNDEKAFQKLASDTTNTIERFDAKGSFNVITKSDTVLEQNLSDLETRIIERLTEYFHGNDSSALKSVDELYYKDLSPDELEVVTKMIAKDINKKAFETNGFGVDLKKLYELIDHNRKVLLAKKIDIRGFNREAWGLLYTIEASRFSYEKSERLSFNGKVTFRINDSPAAKIKLLLTDDRGLIYSQELTNQDGDVIFNNIQPGKRYHILVDDYSIAILGRSRYQLKEISLTAHEEEYLKFYRNLPSDQKRAVDRIIAKGLLVGDYKTNPIHQWEDPAEQSKLSSQEKDLINKITNYLSAQTSNDSSFFLHENFAFQYEQLDMEVRNRFNRFIARQIQSPKTDSLYYAKLTGIEKGFIEQIKNNRRAKKIIIEDILLSKKESDFWYVLDRIDTQIPGNQKAVTVTGKITYLEKLAYDLPVALMDEYGQIVSVGVTDESGKFFIPFVSPNSKYKVLISNGGNITNIRDYNLLDLKIEGGDEDFYKNLSNDEKRIVDRIIATNLSNASYLKDTLMLKKDAARYAQLNLEEKEFIDRLIKHLYASPVTSENTHLQKQDNYHYYFSLTPEARNFINRYIVQHQAGKIKLELPILIKGRDKEFYDRLSENQKVMIQHMQTQRKLMRDIFAENPELIVDKAWIFMDSIAGNSKNDRLRFTISGDIIDRNSKAPVYNIPVMVSNQKNDFLGMVSTDSTGHFQFRNVSSADMYNILIESKRIFLDQLKYELINLRLNTFSTDSINNMASIDVTNSSKDTLVIYFDFDSFKLKPTEIEKLDNWVKANGKPRGLTSLFGHADMIGSEVYNQALSERRAESVKRYLIKSKIPQDEIVTKGFGEKRHRYKIKKMMYLDRKVEIAY